MALTPSRRSELRAQAHKLSPVVIIGDKGLTDEVLAEIDRSLKAHELIKIRAASDDRDARELWMEKICERLQAQAVQQIGKVLVVYRENFDKPREKLDPGPAPRRGGRDDPRKKPRSGDREEVRKPRTFGREEARKPRAFGREEARKPRGFGREDVRKPRGLGREDVRKPRTGDARKPRSGGKEALWKPRTDLREDAATKTRRRVRGDDATRIARPRSRTPSPRPESGPRRRRRSTSR